MTKTTVLAYFTLIGDNFDIDYVTQVLDTPPTGTRNRNEVLGNGRVFGHTEWGISTQEESSRDIEIQLNKVIAPYFDKIDLLNKVRVQCHAEWNILIVVYIRNGDVPAMTFSKENLKFFASIDAEVGFDTYIISTRESSSNACVLQKPHRGKIRASEAQK